MCTEVIQKRGVRFPSLVKKLINLDKIEGGFPDFNQTFLLSQDTF